VQMISGAIRCAYYMVTLQAAEYEVRIDEQPTHAGNYCRTGIYAAGGV